MGDQYEEAQALEDGGFTTDPQGAADGFDSPDEFDAAGDAGLEGTPVKNDPLRPEAKRGRYPLPNPETGKTKSWQRVTNFVKLTDDTYHLELWKQRNVAKGVAILAQSRPGLVDDLAGRDVKADRERLNRVCEKAQEAAEAYVMADEGTALHKSTELADYAGGNLNRVPAHHRGRVSLYLDALASVGISVVTAMIERVTVSVKYEVAGKFDRVYRLMDGSYVIGDLKTGDSLDLSFPSIAAQLDCYRDGVNTTGIFDGQRYEQPFTVRNDIGIVVHLPSTRDEVTVYAVDLGLGAEINSVGLDIRRVRRIKAKHVAVVFDPAAYGFQAGASDQHWLEQLNAAHDMAGLVAVADRARGFGQWNERLASQARLIATELPTAS